VSTRATYSLRFTSEIVAVEGMVSRGPLPKTQFHESRANGFSDGERLLP